MKLNNGFLFLFGEISSFNVWPQVIGPSKPATFPTPQQSWYTEPTKHQQKIKLKKPHQKKTKFWMWVLNKKDFASSFRPIWKKPRKENKFMFSFKWECSTNQLVWGGLSNFHGHRGQYNWWESGLLQGSKGLSWAPFSHSMELSPSRSSSFWWKLSD